MTAAHARLAVYLLTAGIGAFLTVWGSVNGNPEHIATGLGLLGVGGLASANTHPRTGKHAG